MHIKKLRLINFKRFTDLTLNDIPDRARLVLLIGSNGSGKSSVFDAFEVLNKYKNNPTYPDNSYYNKKSQKHRILAEFEEGFAWDTDIKIYQDEPVKFPIISLYGRTSFRQVPRLQRTQLGERFNIIQDSDRPESFIGSGRTF